MTYAGALQGRALLLDMLTHCRPHGSKSEKAFSRRYLDPLGCRSDGFGNRILRIGTAPVLWSSHVDTVHRMGGTQLIQVQDGTVRLHRNSKSNCLGADDTAGVWLMIEMIRRGVEGLYVFHRGEEVGGLGSSFIATKTPELLRDIDFAIALDRKGYDSVITYQGGRCCSDKFAGALSRQLGMNFKPDDTGLFTDTANYTDLVSECTNLSVGYHMQHGPREWQDITFLEELLDALCALDVSALPVSRDPGEPDDDWWPDFGSGSDTLVSLIEDHPEVAADLLEQLGVDRRAFEDAIREYQYL